MLRTYDISVLRHLGLDFMILYFIILPISIHRVLIINLTILLNKILLIFDIF